jgi:hypothetical protein
MVRVYRAFSLYSLLCHLKKRHEVGRREAASRGIRRCYLRITQHAAVTVFY